MIAMTIPLSWNNGLVWIQTIAPKSTKVGPQNGKVTFVLYLHGSKHLGSTFHNSHSCVWHIWILCKSKERLEIGFMLYNIASMGKYCSTRRCWTLHCPLCNNNVIFKDFSRSLNAIGHIGLNVQLFKLSIYLIVFCIL